MSEITTRLNEAKPLPEGWRWVRLEEICGDAETGDPATLPGTTFQYIDISAVGATSKSILGARTILGKEAPSRARQVIRANDVLVATTRPNLNAVALVPAELDNEICSTGFCVLRPTSEIDPLFLFFFVQTNDFVGFVSGEVRGMLYPAVTGDQVRAISVPLPPLPEQKRIASKVQELFKEVERAHAACEAQLEAAKALPQAYLRQVFESEEAKNWERRKLGELIYPLKNGIVSEQNFEGRGFKVTRIETISNGAIDPQKFGYVNLPTEDFEEFRLQQGDILLSHINSVERLGNSAIYDGRLENVFHGMNLLRIRVKSDTLDPSSTVYAQIDGFRTGILWVQNLWHHKPAPPRLRELIAQVTGLLAVYLQ